MAVDTALEQVRLEIGDLDPTNPLFTDDQIQYYIDNNGTNVLMAAADCCDALATRYASNIDFTTDTLAVKKFQRAEFMGKRAGILRDRAGGIGLIGSIKVDGYSQDIDNEDTTLLTSMPVDPEIPRYGPSWASDLARQTDYHPGEGGSN
jgi:hypothetical protein